MTGTPETYCREIEAYLCRKNDGHLIRVVGPSFELVSSWADRGIPVKVAFRGIDRYFERYYRKGPRRRPVRIDFCEADVLDVFDEWRRAIGLPMSGNGADSDVHEDVGRRQRSLARHLERVVLHLTAARTSGRLGPQFDDIIDRLARELDAARAEVRGVRGEARQALIRRLSAIDAELMQLARASLDEAMRTAVRQEAEEELTSFRDRMAPEAFARARDASVDRLIRERCGLPAIALT